MPIQHRFEPSEIAEPLAAALTAHDPGSRAVTVSDIELAHSSGMSNETVFFTARWEGETEQRLVARVPAPTHEGLFLDTNISAEYALMTALARHTPVPVPEPVFIEPSAELLGVPFLVLPYVAGHSPTDDPPYTAAGWVMEQDPAGRAAINDAALRALVALHAVDCSDPRLEGALPRGRDTFAARLHHAEHWLAWAMGEVPHPVAEAALTWLRQHRVETEPDHVITWGDARISNIRFADDYSVRALVDWELAALGPRERDLGWWLFAYRHHTEGIGVPHPDGFPDGAALIARYEALSGHTCEHLDVYEVLGGLEAALIMARVGKQMIGAQMLPPDSPMMTHNPATILLAHLIGLDVTDDQAISFIGNRG